MGIPDFLKQMISNVRGNENPNSNIDDWSRLFQGRESGIKSKQEEIQRSVPPTIQQEPQVQLPQEDPVISGINKYFPEDPKTAKAIFTQESQLGKFFQNLEGSPDYGVAQINLPTWKDEIPGDTEQDKIEWLRDPDNNLKIARMIYDDSLKRNGDGWLPWTAYTSGRYKDYLK